MSAGPTIDEIAAFTLKSRMDGAYDELVRVMNTSLYGDFPGYVPPTRWRRFCRYWCSFPERARDAWLVLKGEADIYD